MLAEIYGWFTEGFDTADLKDAKALLDEIAALTQESRDRACEKNKERCRKAAPPGSVLVSNQGERKMDVKLLFGPILIAGGILYLWKPDIFRRAMWMKTSLAIRLMAAGTYERYMRVLGVVFIVTGVLLTVAGIRNSAN